MQVTVEVPIGTAVPDVGAHELRSTVMPASVGELQVMVTGSASTDCCAIAGGQLIGTAPGLVGAARVAIGAFESPEQAAARPASITTRNSRRVKLMNSRDVACRAGVSHPEMTGVNHRQTKRSKYYEARGPNAIPDDVG